MMNQVGPGAGLGRRTALTALLALTAAPAGAAEDWSAVEAAARKDGRVVFYHNMRPQGAEVLLADFRRAYPGIETEHIRLGSAPLNERFATELNAGRNLGRAQPGRRGVQLPGRRVLQGRGQRRVGPAVVAAGAGRVRPEGQPRQPHLRHQYDPQRHHLEQQPRARRGG